MGKKEKLKFASGTVMLMLTINLNSNMPAIVKWHPITGR